MTQARFDTTIGCRTSEVSSAVLEQLVRVFKPEIDFAAPSAKQEVENLLPSAYARIAELEPTSATETLLAAQMVAAQHATMTFLQRALIPGQPAEHVDANITRATRLMRMFTEQVETMSKLKGKAGQQRVIVEHVTVAAGGQAIVGAVLPGAGGPGGQSGSDRMNPMHPYRAGLEALRVHPRCHARTRRATSCQSPAMWNGRCRLHGGLSTGPRTPEGLERSRKARWVHGRYSREAQEQRKRERQQWRDLLALLIQPESEA